MAHLIQPCSYFQNWAQTYRCHPAGIFRPSTIDEVQEIVAFCVFNNYPLRVVGSCHSPSDLCCVKNNGYLMNLDNLSGIISVRLFSSQCNRLRMLRVLKQVDKNEKLIHVKGGTRLYDFHKEARKEGLALSCLGSISDQSVAGAISTASHGSGINYGTISASVQSLTLVLAADPSKLVTVDASNDPDLFNASLCGLGTTGVIVDATIQCEDDYKLEEEVWCMNFKDFVNNLTTSKSANRIGLVDTAEHVRAWWFPQAREVRVSRLNRTKEIISPPVSAIISFIENNLLGRQFHQLALFIGRYIPSVLHWHARFLYRAIHKPRRYLFPSRTPRFPSPISSTDPSFPRISPTIFQVGLSNNIFNYDCLFPQYTYEGAVPISRAPECLKALSDWLEGEYASPTGIRHHFPIEIRFADADNIWLSPCFKQKMCYIGIVQYRPYGLPVHYRALFKMFQSILLNHDGRPHWAKAHGLVQQDLLKLYPHLPEFNRTRDRVDSTGIFLNPYTQSCLLGDIGSEYDPNQFETEKDSI